MRSIRRPGAGLAATGVLARSANVGQTGVAQTASPTSSAPTTDTVFGEQMGRYEASEIVSGKSPLEAICEAREGPMNTAAIPAEAHARSSARWGLTMRRPLPRPSRPARAVSRPVKVRALRAGVVLEAREGYFVPPRRIVPLPTGLRNSSDGSAGRTEAAGGDAVRSALLQFGESGDAV